MAYHGDDSCQASKDEICDAGPNSADSCQIDTDATDCGGESFLPPPFGGDYDFILR